MTVFWTKKIKMPNERAFNEFLDGMAKRLIQGYCQYGAPDRDQKYLKRMQMEVMAYLRTGNAEHLFNIANYAHLEMYAPQHKRFHFDNHVDSVTRGHL